MKFQLRRCCRRDRDQIPHSIPGQARKVLERTFSASSSTSTSTSIPHTEDNRGNSRGLERVNQMNADHSFRYEVGSYRDSPRLDWGLKPPLWTSCSRALRCCFHPAKTGICKDRPKLLIGRLLTIAPAETRTLSTQTGKCHNVDDEGSCPGNCTG